MKEQQFRYYTYFGDTEFPDNESYGPIIETGADSLSMDKLYIPLESPILSLDEFLFRISKNDQEDVRGLHISAIIPKYIISRVPKNVQDCGTATAISDKMKMYREEVKSKLKIHYLNRVFEVLKQAGYAFKTRSTNWKNSKFYSQMLCSCDVGSKKRALSVLFGEKEKDHSIKASLHSSDLERRTSFPTFSRHSGSSLEFQEQRTKSVSSIIGNQALFSTPLYLCHSRFNYSFDSISGQFHMDFSHLTHSHLEFAIPGKSNLVVQSWIKNLNSSHYQVSDSDSEDMIDPEINSNDNEEEEEEEEDDEVSESSKGVSSEENTDSVDRLAMACHTGSDLFSYPEYDSVSEGRNYLRQVLVETTGDTVSRSLIKNTKSKPMTPFASALDTLHKSISSRTMD
ncbi:hypothetical protein BRETT_004592 [Brettanomyces bruxellensis]|uniref:Uncharacterized protein n=1 Tax=Dekkera bruxellensis TaxID=5007 RepID=A0A871R6X5_DEKBR|nr:uncharacterized protein BRETT_004592 [Brettanomyces bruxellensis]QOU19945.1 hypothetical protein BRETT_004592 [Brettanomyces bruxellensis]